MHFSVKRKTLDFWRSLRLAFSISLQAKLKFLAKIGPNLSQKLLILLEFKEITWGKPLKITKMTFVSRISSISTRFFLTKSTERSINWSGISFFLRIATASGCWCDCVGEILSFVTSYEKKDVFFVIFEVKFQDFRDKSLLWALKFVWISIFRENIYSRALKFRDFKLS